MKLNVDLKEFKKTYNQKKNQVLYYKIKTLNIDNKKKGFDTYYDKTHEKLKSDIFSSYDLYLNNKYNVKIYSRTIERLRNYFK